MKQKSYSNSFKIGFAKAYKSSGAKTVSKFIHRSTHVDYKDIVPHTALEAALSLLREYVIQEGDTEDAMKHVNILAGRIRSKRLAKIVNNTQTTIYDYFA